MKKHFLQGIFFCTLLTAIPLIPAYLIHPEAEAQTIGEPESEFSTTEQETVENPPLPETASVYRVLQEETGEILEIPVQEYLIGAVAAEMPASFEPEALKAQAVASHTYAERQRLISQSRGEPENADFSDDPDKYQAYLTNEELLERWGTHYALYYEKISTAVEETVEYLLVYENEPIVAAFHAMSSGKTESAENVWGTQVPYLQPVESPADETAPGFEGSVTVGASDALDRLQMAHEGLTVSGDAAEWFGAPVCTESGTVLSVSVGDGIFTGQEMRRIFGLKSAAFTITFADGKFTFHTRGSGHDVGMSQYGANAMALDGKEFREILAYYYPNAELAERG